MFVRTPYGSTKINICKVVFETVLFVFILNQICNTKKAKFLILWN